MSEYIFLTVEEFTHQPDIVNGLIEIENLQVIGFASGANSDEAYLNLLSENPFLRETSYG